jgi:acyl transferase domain-containing protein/thioesterase domain-containing protein
MVLAMEHGVLPKTLHVSAPTPHVDWSSAVELLTQAKRWTRRGHPRRCGVSAFGVSGTNGHVILEEAPEASAEGAPRSLADEVAAPVPASGVAERAPWLMPFVPLLLSSKSAAGLRAQADGLAAAWEAHPEWTIDDVGYSLSARSTFKHRAALFAADRRTALQALSELARGAAGSGVIEGIAHPAGRLAFLFTGQGSQRAGMGRELHAAFPPFAEAFDAACARLSEHLGCSLRDVVFAEESSASAALLDQTLYTQAALFAIETALFRLLEAWGVTPDLLLGHSIGELVAAHVAGVFDLEDACLLVAARGRLMQACRSDGAMVAIEASADEVGASLAGLEGKVEIATVNGPLSTVIAGDENAVLLFAEQWLTRRRRVKRLRVSHAFHSPHMDGMLADFRRVAESIAFAPPAIPIVSNTSGDLATDAELTSPEYWARHVRRPVRFFDGMRCLGERGATAFLEVGPDSVLTALGEGCLAPEIAGRALLVPAMRPHRDELGTLTAALARLHGHGARVNFRAAFVGRGAQRVDLPTYAFQRQRYWLEASHLAANVARAAPPAPEGRRYRAVWRPAADAIRTLSGTWLVFAPQAREQPDYGLLSWLTSGLAGRGGRVRLIALEGELDRARIAAELAAVRAQSIGVGGVLSLFALDESPHSGNEAVSRGLVHTLILAQAWAEHGTDAPLWCVTQGAVSVDGSDPLRSTRQAMVWGLGRVFALEHPKRWGGLIDLPALLDDRVLRDLCAALAGRDGEDQCAVRAGGVFVRRLVRAEEEPAHVRPWRPRGTTLITGGTGAIGAHVARWLAANGAENLVLVSRQGLAAPGAPELVAELAASGARTSAVTCDVSDRSSVARLLEELSSQPPLTAVVHAAGISGRFAPAAELTPEELARVVSGKVAGAIHLDALLGDRQLDAFVVLSSIAGVWGSGGQGAYAAGNAFLDALAQHRRARGLAGSAIAWGPWAGGGMAADTAIEAHLRRCGLVPMVPERATELLWRAVSEGEATTTIAEIDWERFVSTFTSGRRSRLFDELRVAEPAEAEGDTDVASLAWFQGLGSPEEQHRALRELVCTHAAKILGSDAPERIDPDARFLDLGFDSLAAVELRKRLAKATGLPLPPTVVFDHSTANALANYLHEEFVASAPVSPRMAGPQVSADGVAAQVLPARSPAIARDGASGAIRLLYRDACDRGLLEEGIELLRAAAKLRPVFREPPELRRRLESVSLAAGPRNPALICFPPFVAPSGPHNYARLALHLEGLLEVRAFSLPGFGDGDPVPDSRELIVDMLAESVARELGDGPLALLGYSSGGWFAHAVAERLEARGTSPRAVVLLDSLSLKGERWEKVRAPLRNIAINERAFALATDDQLTAMAAYLRIFDGWKPNPILAPIVVVRARECIPEWEGERLSDDFWRGSWDLPHQILEVPGDHFTIVNENAVTTALSLHAWFSR